MALYQDKIMDQIRQIGKPRESKSTTVQTAEPQNQPFDVGGLLMMLMMMNMFKDPGAGGGLQDALGAGRTADVFAPGVNPVPGIAGPDALSGPPSAGGGLDVLGQLLLALMGAGGGGLQGGQMPGLPMGTGVPGSPF